MNRLLDAEAGLGRVDKPGPSLGRRHAVIEVPARETFDVTSAVRLRSRVDSTDGLRELVGRSRVNNKREGTRGH